VRDQPSSPFGGRRGFNNLLMGSTIKSYGTRCHMDAFLYIIILYFPRMLTISAGSVASRRCISVLPYCK
jgi:hypothetical protein